MPRDSIELEKFLIFHSSDSFCNLFTVELFMLSHVEKRKKSVVGKSIVLRGQKVV
jgi:small nuclear ribonucleoprotein (snRNP)-like protein